MPELQKNPSPCAAETDGREEERKQKLEKYTLQIKENEKQIALMHQQLDKSFKTPDPNERTENIAALNRQYRRISSEIDRKKNEISRLNRLISRSEN